MVTKVCSFSYELIPLFSKGEKNSKESQVALTALKNKTYESASDPQKRIIHRLTEQSFTRQSIFSRISSIAMGLFTLGHAGKNIASRHEGHLEKATEQFKSDAFFTATLSKWAGKDKNKLKAMEAITTFCKNKSNTILCLDRFKLSDLPVEVFHLPSMSHCNELSVKEDAIFEPTHFSGDGDAWYFKQNEHSLESDLKRLPKDIEVKKWTERQIFKQA